MNRTILFIIILAATAFTTLAVAAPVEAPASCDYCGMDRTKFAHSRMLVTYTGGKKIGTCSINCAAVDRFANKGKKVKQYQAGDYATKKLIPATTATWVIGGSKRGVMSPVAKWAFSDKQAAQAYVTEYGGRLATFAEAMDAAAKELQDEQQEHTGSHGHDHGSHH